MSKTKYTFQNERYITKGVSEKICSEIQLILWCCIDNHVSLGLTMDYLQVFEFSQIEVDGKKVLCISHKQEKPIRVVKHKVVWQMKFQSILGHKIFVIDDISHSTMLLSEEY